MRLPALLSVVAFAIALPATAAAAQGAGPASPNAKPTNEEKRCKASQRRVERQQEVIAETDARMQAEKRAREACRTKRACDSRDRALNAAQTRHDRYVKQLAQLESEASKACAAVQPRAEASAPAPR